MGAQASKDGGDDAFLAGGGDCAGYRVLGVQPDSPASEAGLVSFFDFILDANGQRLNTLDATFINIIKDFEDRELSLAVYNFKSKTMRTVVLTPTRRWGGGTRDGMLGVTIKFDTYLDADESLCHVLEVEADSPAELAGLQAETDYLLGTNDAAYKDTEVLLDSLMANLDQPMEIYVYSKKTDEVRTVVLMPTNEGRENRGVLGANVAHGILHTLPSACCNTIGKTAVVSNNGLGLEEGDYHLNINKSSGNSDHINSDNHNSSGNIQNQNSSSATNNIVNANSDDSIVKNASISSSIDNNSNNNNNNNNIGSSSSTDVKSTSSDNNNA